MTSKADLQKQIDSANAEAKPRDEPLWRGPHEDGITFSMLSKFLICPERFRVRYCEGIKPKEVFNHKIEYGNLWHAAEETYGEGEDWQTAVREYASELSKQYPTEQSQIQHWYRVCVTQFPVYLQYWEDKVREDVYADPGECLARELTFDVPFTREGKCFRLRGKFDGINLVSKGPDKGIYLYENKTKGQVNTESVQNQLSFDLQTMMYLQALRVYAHCATKAQKKREGLLKLKPENIRGVIYNVVRRPLSGGKGTIIQKKERVYRRKDGTISKTVPGETANEFYRRLHDDVLTECPDEFFFRWRSVVKITDQQRFNAQCFTPLLMWVSDWYEHIKTYWGEHYWSVYSPLNWTRPYGLWRTLDEGGETEIDGYIHSESMIGLERTTDLFTELD